MTTITLVKKVLADGTPCAKCDDVLARLERDGVWHRIDRVVTADERAPDSEGLRIAERYGVERAPFFVVEREGEEAQVYTVYMRVLRDVLQAEDGGDERERAIDLADAGAVDFL